MGGWRGVLPHVVLIVGGLVAPLVFYPVFLMQIWCMALFACAFNLLLGYAGLLSFGHAAFLGAAAYITGHAAMAWRLPNELAILAGVAVAAFIGLVMGVVAIRRQGIYFAMITLAVAQMVYFIALQAPFTNGEDGMQGIPRGKLLGLIDLRSDVAMAYFTFGLFLAGFYAVWRVVRSPFGKILQAIRDNEPRAISLGYRADAFKLIAFVISAALSGLAGAMKALVFQVVPLSDIHWFMSGTVVLMVLLGGMGTFFGPIVGVVALVAMEHYLEFLGSWLTLVMGVVYIACVHVFRRGVVGELARILGARPEVQGEAR